jgi:glycosyltransferase involved in cell wall biosynthesis
VKISAIICTHNRSGCLAQAIQSVAQQTLAHDDYEIIVVDNASTDETKDVVTRLMSEVSNLRYVQESNPGLSRARNRGLKEACAPIVAFLDDDASANNEWLAVILEAFSTEPCPACVGGPVEPCWEIPKPNWFPESLVGCHYLSFGHEPRWCRFPSEHPIGCNMAFLKNRVDKLGGFNVLLNKYNDETELMQRIAEAGGGIFYHPRASVRHLVAKERLTLGWQMRRYYEEGMSRALAATCQNGSARNGRISELGKNLALTALRGARIVLSRGSIPDRVKRMAQLSTSIGTVVYLTKSFREK